MFGLHYEPGGFDPDCDTRLIGKVAKTGDANEHDAHM